MPEYFVSAEEQDGNIESGDIIKDVVINEGVEKIGSSSVLVVNTSWAQPE